MDLYKGSTYWDKTLEPNEIFQRVEKDIKTKHLIVGGGVSGSLMAYVLSSKGGKVTLIDANKVGRGSSSVNTGLLQYCSDTMLTEFLNEIGEEKAVLFYKMCLEAMDSLTSLSKVLDDQIEYRLRDSIYYASSEKDAKKLKREYKYLEKYDFPVAFLDQAELNNKYKIDKECALKTWHDADINPYKFVMALTKANLEQGVTYYENTQIDLENIEDHWVYTKEGKQVEFENLILATGYTKIYPVIKDKATINRTYAFCSKPINFPLWPENVMVWETKSPYLYFRTTIDNRIIAGGLDEEKDEVEKDEAMVNQKLRQIKEEINTLFPHLTIEIEYGWNALFGCSKDGLPFIGRDPKS